MEKDEKKKENNIEKRFKNTIIDICAKNSILKSNRHSKMKKIERHGPLTYDLNINFFKKV